MEKRWNGMNSNLDKVPSAGASCFKTSGTVSVPFYISELSEDLVDVKGCVDAADDGRLID
jgi:hypothetical protein